MGGGHGTAFVDGRGRIGGLIGVHLNRHRHTPPPTALLRSRTLVRWPYTMQRPQLLPGRAPTIRVVGQGQRLVGPHLDQSVEMRINLLDPRKAALDDLTISLSATAHRHVRTLRGRLAAFRPVVGRGDVSELRDRLDVVKPSERYRQDAELIRAFRETYVNLLNHAKLDRADMYSLTKVVPDTDHQTWQRLRTAVATAAGAAASAYRRYGGTFTLRNAAYIMHDVDPVTNWEMSLHDPEQLSPESVISAAESAIAVASQRQAEAAQREHGLTGLIAAFLRWSSDLREAVGADHPRQRTAAGVIGVFAQALAATLATAVATGVVAGVVSLWRWLFI